MNLTTSTLYEKFSNIKNEILKHKWIESEKVRRDIGFENALVDWNMKYHAIWIKNNLNNDGN